MTGWIGRLRAGLRSSAQALKSGVQGLFSSTSDWETTRDALFDVLIQHDLGPAVAEAACASLDRNRPQNLAEAEERLADFFSQSLRPYARPFQPGSGLTIVIMAGVNGAGKTTTIAKLSQQYIAAGRRVAWAACDTFRAAATEQLEVWSTRLGVPLYQSASLQNNPTEPAAIALGAARAAAKEGGDLLFVDTAGRLHNNKSLMQELAKTHRVLQQHMPMAALQTLLVLDGTTGQNALVQVDTFGQYLPLTGVIVTKLDGTARAGFLVRLCSEKKLPVCAIGVGESADDLSPLDPEAFSRALLGL